MKNKRQPKLNRKEELKLAAYYRKRNKIRLEEKMALLEEKRNLK